jgi:predicted outer membrane protein
MSRFMSSIFLPLALFAVPAAAQSPTDRLTPTIPETQIEPAPLSSPYEFLSVATSASDFFVESAALATAKNASSEVKALAETLTATHKAMKADLAAAGKTDGVEVAKPAMDGEQTGLMGKLRPLDGPAFDAAYVDAQLFVHQRTIAYFRGYADRQDALGEAARRLMPTLVADYVGLVALAEKSASTQPAR